MSKLAAKLRAKTSEPNKEFHSGRPEVMLDNLYGVLKVYCDVKTRFYIFNEQCITN